MKKNQLDPSDLTDRQWDCIKNLIPPAKPGGRPRELDMRVVINAILYLESVSDSISNLGQGPDKAIQC